MTNGTSRFRTGVVAALSIQLALSGPTAAVSAAPGAPADEAAVVHVLNRLTFGASPAEIERVKQAGVKAWIEAQLAPASGEDKALTARLASIETLAMSTEELREKYEIPPNVRQEIQKVRAEREEAAEKAKAAGAGGSAEATSPADREAERQEMMKRFPEMARIQGRPQQVIADLQAAKVLRAAYAERQLEEVMVDFWFNHFNVFARKGPIEFMVGEYERTLRRHALGKFEDLLVATAQSPAMLFYLDNWQSTDPNFDPRANRRGQNQRPQQGQGGMGRGGARRPGGRGGDMSGMDRPMNRPGGQASRPNQGPPRRTFGLNENYARELMELHTLGVDAGYTQADVVEVAKAFTGWTILGEGPVGPRRSKDSRFGFEADRHVKGDKKFMGVTIREGGEKEGLEILHRLATHPKTATFIATKLTRRLVADNPPPAMVQRAAATFEKTNGDIREVIRAIVTSDEFLGPSFRAAKVKTPLEFVVSSIRATGADVRNARDLTQRISNMGMPLYLHQPPTGYKDTAEEWISTSALLERMNFALDLSGGRVRGVRLAQGAAGADTRTIEGVAARLVPGGLSENSKKTLEAEARKEGSEPMRVVGLVLGSPEFQRR
jgi:uncharacterized protein (DUF1800 family)